MAWLWRELVPLLALLLSPALVSSTCVATTTSGQFFRCELTLQDFNITSGSGTDGGSILSYRLRQTGYAGLPGWISVAAARTANNIILHGTPTEGDEGVLHLMVTVLTDSYQFGVRNVLLTVQPLSGQIAQYSEFFLTSHNVDELLNADAYEELMTALTELYAALGGFEPILLALVNPRERHIVIPEPPAKIGVILQVTPGLNIESELPTATPQAASSVQGSCSGSVIPPPLNFNAFSLHGFTINWCRYAVQYRDTPLINDTSETPPPSGIATPTSSGTVVTLVVIAVVVGVVSLLFLCILTCMFFCGRRFSIVQTKSQRYKNSMILQDTNSSILETSKAQVVLRNLSALPPPEEGVVRGLATEVEQRPESTDTACLEYEDVPGDNDTTRLESRPPSYRYNPRLFPPPATRSPTPSD